MRLNILKVQYGKEWYVIELLKRGIGIHHGKTPMYLRKFFENEYNKRNIKTLLCTNTLMEGINTPTQELIIVDDTNSSFELNNLIGRVGRLNVKKPQIGKILLCDKNTLNNLVNTDTWMDLKILAEEPTIESNDEVLYLNKVYMDINKKDLYNEKLAMLNKEYSITEELMIQHMVEFDATVKFVKSGVMQELIRANNLYECVVATVKLLGGPSHSFRKDRFCDLDLNIDYLPYKKYILKLITKSDYKELIEDFNDNYNWKLDVENINIFIDALYDLNNYIKFKFGKIVNYIELFNIGDSSAILKKFKNIVSAYSNTEISYKILEDLGIDGNDIGKIVDKLDIKDNTSTSSIIRYIRIGKEELLKEDISPFSKNNISNM